MRAADRVRRVPDVLPEGGRASRRCRTRFLNGPGRFRCRVSPASETGFRRSRWQVSRQLEGFQTPAGPEPGALESTRARRFDRRIQRDQRLSESFMQMRAIPSGTRFRVSSVRFYYARMSTLSILQLSYGCSSLYSLVSKPAFNLHASMPVESKPRDLASC